MYISFSRRNPEAETALTGTRPSQDGVTKLKIKIYDRIKQRALLAMPREQQLAKVSRNNVACVVLQVIAQTPNFTSHS